MTPEDIMRAKKISQRKLSELTGLSVPTINRAVNGQRVNRPTIKLIRQALDAIEDVPVDKAVQSQEKKRA